MKPLVRARTELRVNAIAFTLLGVVGLGADLAAGGSSEQILRHWVLAAGLFGVAMHFLATRTARRQITVAPCAPPSAHAEGARRVVFRGLPIFAALGYFFLSFGEDAADLGGLFLGGGVDTFLQARWLKTYENTHGLVVLRERKFTWKQPTWFTQRVSEPSAAVDIV